MMMMIGPQGSQRHVNVGSHMICILATRILTNHRIEPRIGSGTDPLATDCDREQIWILKAKRLKMIQGPNVKNGVNDRKSHDDS